MAIFWPTFGFIRIFIPSFPPVILAWNFSQLVFTVSSLSERLNHGDLGAVLNILSVNDCQLVPTRQLSLMKPSIAFAFDDIHPMTNIPASILNKPEKKPFLIFVER